MLLGFGCTVPAIMGTRTLENRRDRLTTIMVLPFMSCGARLPVYSLIIPAFFPDRLQAWMLWLIYVIGILFAIVGAKLLRSTLFQGESVPFVMELPPYRMPTFRSVVILMWDRAREYVKKAGTIILGVSILLWAMTTYPKNPEPVPTRVEARAELDENSTELENLKRADALSYSISGRIGHALEPVFRPLGFDWRIVTAIIGSFAAKEVFVAQMGIVYSVGEADEDSDSLRERLREHYTPLQAFCMMLWALLSVPCVATIAVARRETGGWSYAVGMMIGFTLIAYVSCLIVYQVGGALGIGG
jgi:ferrous iron transport protein B